MLLINNGLHFYNRQTDENSLFTLCCTSTLQLVYISYNNVDLVMSLCTNHTSNIVHLKVRACLFLSMMDGIF